MSDTMSKNAAAIREFTRVFKNEHNVDGVNHLFAPEFQHHFRIPVPPGLEGYKAMGRMMNGAFPDVHVSEDLLVVTDDFVIERSSAVATNRGEFMGMKPSGREVRWYEIHIYRMKNAKIVEHWVELSTLELVEQIRSAKST